MQRRSVLIAGLLVSAALAGCASSRGSGGSGNWVTLLDGKSLTGWNQIGNGNWRIEDGLVVGDKGKAGFLVSPRTYKDFQIRAEFWASDDANSGIFIRGEDAQKMTGTNAYEVNIYDKRPDPSYATGAIVNVARAPMVFKAGGRWNTFVITARGPILTVDFNGVRTVDNVRDTAHASGYLGLQSDGGVIKFRKLEIREL